MLSNSESRARSRSRQSSVAHQGNARRVSCNSREGSDDEIVVAIDAVLKGEAHSLAEFLALLSKYRLGTRLAWQAGLHKGLILDKVLPCLLEHARKKPFSVANGADLIALVEYIYTNHEMDVDWNEFMERYIPMVVDLIVQSAGLVDISVQPPSLQCDGHDERCLCLLSSMLYYGHTAIIVLNAKIDLWPWCLWWLRSLLATPEQAALSTKKHHAFIVGRLCNSFSIDYVLDKGIVGIFLKHHHPGEAYQRLIADLVLRSSSCGPPATKFLAVRVGIPMLAWTSDPWRCNVGKVMAWIYPAGFWRLKGVRHDCQILRGMLKEATSVQGLEPFLSLKLFVSPYRIIHGNTTLSSENCLLAMLTRPDSFFEWDIREFLSDICRRAIADSMPSVFSEFAVALNNVLAEALELMSFTDLYDMSMYQWLFHCQLPSHDEQISLVRNFCLWKDLQSSGPLRFLLSSESPILGFGVRSSYLQKHLEYVRARMNERDCIVLVVPRANVTNGVCHSLALDSTGIGNDAPDGNIEIQFSGEMGVDQGGVRRAWLDAVSSHYITSDFFHELVENAFHLSEPSVLANQRRPGGRRWTPAAEPVCETLQADWEEHFRLLGAILGYALLNGDTLSIRFAPHVWEAMLQSQSPAPLSLHRLLEKLSVVDATLAEKLKCIRDSAYRETWGVDTLAVALEAAGLRQTFCVAVSRNADLVRDHELKPSGNALIVTEQNKEEYLSLVSMYYLHGSIEKQTGLMRTGLLRALCPHALEWGLLQQNGKVVNIEEFNQKLVELSSDDRPLAEILYSLCYSFNHDELDKLFSGSDLTHEDIEQWRANTQYEDLDKNGDVVKWFWSVVSKMNAEELTQLLKFLWGSSTLPHEGLTRIFTLRRMGQGPTFLPVAHTCEFSLDLPDFASESELRDKLHRAMQEETFQIQ